jgi:hypothetical protein
MQEKDDDNSMNKTITGRFSEAIALLLVTIVMVYFFIKFIFY